MIFSRKGFDSKAGGCPSPIIDGRLVSLPIPTERYPSCKRYCDMNGGYGELVSELTRGRIAATEFCHLDPDIYCDVLDRKPGWRGAFGQSGGQLSHLENAGVTIGDLFLFFGMFQPVERDFAWRFCGKPQHWIFGWLQVGDILRPARVEDTASYAWLSDHPHAQAAWISDPKLGSLNAIYIAAESLTVSGVRSSKSGSGVFRQGHRLTAEGKTASIWTAPAWLNPKLDGVGMTYHGKDNRWSAEGLVSTTAPGQDFVADIEPKRQEAEQWLANLFNQYN